MLVGSFRQVGAFNLQAPQAMGPRGRYRAKALNRVGDGGTQGPAASLDCLESGSITGAEYLKHENGIKQQLDPIEYSKIEQSDDNYSSRLAIKASASAIARSISRTRLSTLA